MKNIHVMTYGCQMNMRDSEEVIGMLQAIGYTQVTTPEAADVVLMNTCSVREQAEHRAFSNMGRLRELKASRPEMIFGVLGCMAKLQQRAIFHRLPFVDLVCGPAELYDLPDLLKEVQQKRQRVLAVGRSFRPLDAKPAGEYHAQGVSAFVTIMEGCDKRCTYCIVPATRGQEVSRPADEVIAEVQALVAAGYSEITLLGQNVNSYGKRHPDGSGFKGPLGRTRRTVGTSWIDFPGLLRRIDAETDVRRVRFTTSHPFDAHEDLFQAMADCPSVCEYLHLPVQSGSDNMLKAMHRGYTVESYLAKVDRVRRLVPSVALSTDIIVGFPGETDADFDATLRLMERVQYDNAFVFKYSPRPGTLACDLSDDVPVEVKAARNQRVLDLQRRTAEQRQAAWSEQVVEVLLEGQRDNGQLIGKTRNCRMVACDGSPDNIGTYVRVYVEQVLPHRLQGRML